MDCQPCECRNHLFGRFCAGGLWWYVGDHARGNSEQRNGVDEPGKNTCTVSVDVMATIPGAFKNTIPAKGLVSNEGQSNGGAATASFQTGSKVGVSKQLTPAVVTAGERSRLRINFYNPTPVALGMWGLVDQLLAAASGGGQMIAAPGPNIVQTCGDVTKVDVSDPKKVVISTPTWQAQVPVCRCNAESSPQKVLSR